MISQQVNKYSNKEQHLHVPTRNKLQSSPATNNTIRGDEQGGNIAKQRFAGTRWVRGSWQYGRHDIASGRYHRIAKRASNYQAKIEVISRVWSSCLRSRKEEERVHEEDKRA